MGFLDGRNRVFFGLVLPQALSTVSYADVQFFLAVVDANLMIFII